MNTTSPSPSPDTSLPPAPAPAAAQPHRSSRGAVRALAVALGLLALLLLAEWWHTERELKALRQDMALRLKTGEAAGTETRLAVKSVQDMVKDIQAKVNVLEGKQTESQSQQLALEQMYQELSRNRDDWALAEVEQVLSTAGQQLQLAGNVQGAVIALQNADNRLSQSDQPQFIMIRRALANDLERLKALPAVDLAGLALRLDSIISQVDGMPLLSDEKPALPASEPRESSRRARAAGDAAQGSDWLATLEETWHSWSSEMWLEIRQLVRIRDVNTPDALLLTPSQAYYARENLKLRLLNARLALLTRNEGAFRSDLAAAQDAIGKYFDTRARQTQTVQALLRQVQASNLSIEMPTLAESLNAVRNHKARP